jgi:hypothetical protein
MPEQTTNHRRDDAVIQKLDVRKLLPPILVVQVMRPAKFHAGMDYRRRLQQLPLGLGFFATTSSSGTPISMKHFCSLGR